MLFGKNRFLTTFANHYHIWNKILEYQKRKPHELKWLECFQLKFTPKNENEQKQIAKVIQDEIHLKFSHMITLFDKVPYFLAKNPNFLQIQSLYVNSFSRIYQNRSSLLTKEYNSILSDVKNQHQNVPIQLSRIYFQQVNKDPEIKDRWQSFLTQFYQHRITLRLHLTHIQWLIDNSSNTIQNSMMNTLDIHHIVKYSVEQVKELAKINRIYHIPHINYSILINQKQKIYYIPSHINFILNEILKNSIWACQSNPNSLILFSVFLSGKYIIFRIEDNGKGLSPMDALRCFNFCETSHPDPRSILDDAEVSSPFYGFGHGLPLCRLYARFLGGDLYLIPRPEKGAFVELILPVLPPENFEI